MTFPHFSSAKKQWYSIAFVVIIAITVFFRFYAYERRWGLAYDQAHDALIARYALSAGKIPLVGPFSSAGPFQTGGQWYWIIMMCTAIFPYAVVTPWVVMTALSVVLVALTMFFGNAFINKKYSIVLGLIAATSVAQSTQSVNLTNQTPLALVAMMSVICGVLFLRTQKLKFILLTAFFITSEALIHLQGVMLVPSLLLLFLLSKRKDIYVIFSIILGGFAALVPILLFDVRYGFINSKGFISYFVTPNPITYDALGRRWLTYMGTLIPHMWGLVSGGTIYIAWISIACAVLGIGWSRKICRYHEGIWIGGSLLMAIIVTRYSKTPLYDSYFVFLHPFIFIGVSLGIYALLRKKFIIGIVCMSVVVLGNIFRWKTELQKSSNISAIRASYITNALYAKFPNQTFQIFDHNAAVPDMSSVLSLYIEAAGKSSPVGKRIGVKSSMDEVRYPMVVDSQDGLHLVDLDAIPATTSADMSWTPRSAKYFYDITQYWPDIEKAKNTSTSTKL